MLRDTLHDPMTAVSSFLVGTKFELGERPQLFFEDGVTIDEESYSVLGYGDVVTARRSARSSMNCNFFEPLREKTNNLHMRKQRPRSASR